VATRTSKALRALSAAIRRRRKALGFTQEDVAHRAGLSVRHYQSLESGAVNPSYLVVRSVAEALAIGISLLIADFEQASPAGPKGSESTRKRKKR
jgi:transcriptional regulator with XRE-family HTH domain